MAFDARQRSTMLLQNCSICTIGFKNNTKKKSQSSGLRINRLSPLLVYEENWLPASKYKTFRSSWSKCNKRVYSLLVLLFLLLVSV